MRYLLLCMLVSFPAFGSNQISNPLNFVTTNQLTFHCQFSRLLHYSSRHYDDLVYFDSSSQSIMVAVNDGHGKFTQQKSIYHTKSVSSLVIGTLNADGIDDIVIIHREQNRIEALVSNNRDSTYSATTLAAGYYPENVTMGDITNDGIPDIMCYGRLSSGITLIAGKKDGHFSEPKIIFPNIPVSDLFIVTLNSDEYMDIAIFNWLTNELTLYFGTGQLKFSEQTVLAFGSDSVNIACEDINDDGITDLAISSAQYKTLQIYEGDGLGTYTHTQTLTLSQTSLHLLPFHPTRSVPASFISENSVEGTFCLYLNKGDGNFYEEIVFGMDSSVTSFSIGTMEDNGGEDVLAINTNAYNIYWNNPSPNIAYSTQKDIPVGKNPSNVFVTDINRDGRDDILVSNYGSSTVSLLTSSERETQGQISFETPDNPTSISLYANTDSVLTFFTVHKKSSKIGVITIQKQSDSSANLLGDVDIFSLPLPETPVTVLPDISPFLSGISLYAFMPSSTNAIVFYQQIQGISFISKSLVPIIPTKIIYSTISDLNGDGKTDLLYLYSDTQLKREFLGVTYNDSTSNYKGKVLTTELPDTTTKRGFIYVEDFNGDHIKDCILYASPQNAIFYFSGLKDGGFKYQGEIAHGVNVKASDQVQLIDYNNDGIPDIVFSESSSNELQCMLGKGNGLFRNPQKILSLPEGAAFRCGDFNGDGIIDIVFTHPNGFTVTVQYGTAGGI